MMMTVTRTSTMMTVSTTMTTDDIVHPRSTTVGNRAYRFTTINR